MVRKLSHLHAYLQICMRDLAYDIVASLEATRARVDRDASQYYI